MALADAQAIDAIAARMTGQPLAGSRVYTSRVWPLSEAELPAWRVTASVTEVQLAMLAGTNEHLLSITADGYVRAVNDLDDRMHDLAEEALAALWATQPPYDLQLTGIDRDMATEAEASVGRITLRLQARIFVAPSAPGSIL